MKSQQELFDDLYKEVPPEEYTATLKRLSDEASARTADLKVAKDKARDSYGRVASAYDLCWKEAWIAARTEMVLEAKP